MTEESVVIWQALRKRGDAAAREKLVRTYIHLVRLTAGRIAVHLPSHISEEDLHSAGALGLLNAIDRFDPDRDVKFETFAITRIRGAILDELRRMDVLGRGTRDRITRIRASEKALRNEGKELTLEGLARHSGLSETVILDAERALHTAHVSSLHEIRDEEGHTGADLLADGHDDSPTAGLEREELRHIMDEVLDKREKLLVALYYHEELTLKEIGEVLDVTEGRVSQMHAGILKKLRWRLERTRPA